MIQLGEYNLKRIFASVLFLGMIFSSSVMASATEIQPFRASPTLGGYNVWLFSGSGKGEIIVSYEVSASIWADSLGVERIRFYTEDGDLVDTVYGSTSNGLVRNNYSFHMADFDYDLPSGEDYYAEVTVFAEYKGVYDSRTITTNTVWVR